MSITCPLCFAQFVTLTKQVNGKPTKNIVSQSDAANIKVYLDVLN